MTVLSVVIADDDPAILKVLAAYMQSAGHNVRCASSGAEATQLMRERRCDLLITDVMMPDGDGLELIGRIRCTHKHAKVIAISGGARAITSTQCTKMAGLLGADAVLQKPFARPQLLAAIEELFTPSAPYANPAAAPTSQPLGVVEP